MEKVIPRLQRDSYLVAGRLQEMPICSLIPKQIIRVRFINLSD